MVKIIAHRGFSGKYPENTLLAIKKAVEFGVDGVEIDARLTIDGRVILLHDPWLGRTTTGRGAAHKKTYAEIRSHKLRKSKEKKLHIPTLEEVFPLVKGKTLLNIEIKGVAPAKAVAKLIKKHEMQQHVLVSSGFIQSIKIINQESPSVKTALLFYVSNNPHIDYFVNFLSKIFFKLARYLILRRTKIARRLAKINYVHISFPFATKGFIKKLHKEGYKVNVWPINTKALMKKVIKKDADGIITNHPEKLKQVLKEMKIKNKEK